MPEGLKLCAWKEKRKFPSREKDELSGAEGVISAMGCGQSMEIPPFAEKKC